MFLTGTIVFLGFIYLIEPGPEGRINYLYTTGRLLLYKYSIIADELSAEETSLLYESRCTRKCHSRDVIEKTPRTAREWNWIVTRMRTTEKAGITEREAKTITGYLQENYLSNVPTILPEKVMRFLKKNLWKVDFGENDIYFDLIYLPRGHLGLLPYLGVDTSPKDEDDILLFVLFINTHQGVLPPWNLAEMAILKDDRDLKSKAVSWKVVYEDGAHHHRQGILTFPNIKKGKGNPATLEVLINLPGMRERVFRWNLPIPSFKDNGDATS